MITPKSHSFHIPVMGIGFTVDTPIKVAKFGISSTLSILEDDLLEHLRKYYSELYEYSYQPIPKTEFDSRAKRITAYLNLLHLIVNTQLQHLRELPFSHPEVQQYLTLLPDDCELKVLYNNLSALQATDKKQAEEYIMQHLHAGSIDVNIMTKIDNPAYDAEGNQMAQEHATSHAALRGFANSNLRSSVVFSAGLNPRLYSYCAEFKDFFPDNTGIAKKKIILKVSDYRSALIQGKFFAKKGLWVSEFRIESGLNCGGHAFATEGYLMGPILEEFKQKRKELYAQLFEQCNQALTEQNKPTYTSAPELKITAQGGVGNVDEHRFLLGYYELNSIGWGSPFLLVPEATTMDPYTLNELAKAKPEDYYLSNASPLGVPFNNFRNSSSETLRKQRIAKGKSGSPCIKKYLQFNTEFTEKPICTASVKYQYFKQRQLKQTCATEEEFDLQQQFIQEKDCLCEGLSEPALQAYNIENPVGFGAVSVCPGPNLAYFSGTFTLKQMIDHIYGRMNVLNQVPRSNVFVNELRLYINYLKKEREQVAQHLIERKDSYFEKFTENLVAGIEYYHRLIDQFGAETGNLFNGMHTELDELLASLQPHATVGVTA